jgi:hypothetical protein
VSFRIVCMNSFVWALDICSMDNCEYRGVSRNSAFEEVRFLTISLSLVLIPRETK